VVEALPNTSSGAEISNGILGCHCCLFPVVAGIPVMHLQSEAVAARAALEAGAPDRAFRELVAPGDEALARRFEKAAVSSSATYRDLVDLLGAGFEGGYFLHRFSDPSFVVANTLVRVVAGAVLGEEGRAIDLCGGSGHLSRTLLGLSSSAPVIADLSFAKLWLASNFVSPGCEPVCCDSNAPLPFSRGSFRFALCADAFMFVWTKRQLVSEMARLIEGRGPGALVITHAHNAAVWSPSHGQALSHAGYRDLFETLEPRLFAESGLLDDVVSGGPLDLSRRDTADTLDADPALDIVAVRGGDVFRRHTLPVVDAAPGVLRLNPHYEVETSGATARLRLRFPSPEYEEEFGACRRYLPDDVIVARTTLEDLAAGRRSGPLLELLRHRVVLALPARYC